MIDNETFTVQEKPSVILSGVCNFNKKNKVGRPKKKVRWPSNEFTFEDILEVNEGLSKSSIRNKVIERLKSQSLVKSGKIKTKFGRPKDLYKEVQ